MDAQLRVILKAGKKNKQFLADIWNADQDSKPGIFASSLEEHIFVNVYYGWLVGKYGSTWRDYI